MEQFAATLEDRVALVIGGTGGIGAAVCQALAFAGATIVAAGRSPNPSSEDWSRLRESVSEARLSYEVADVTRTESCHALMSNVVARHGGLDAVLDCSNIMMPGLSGRFSGVDPARFADFLLLKPGALFNVCHAALPHLVQRGGGSIVAFAADSGRVAAPNQSIVGSSNAAIMMFVRSLALELATQNIRVNCISTSFVKDTPVYAHVMNGPLRSRGETAAARAGLGLPLAHDVAELALFLCGPGSAHLTGQVISVNGGVSAG